MEHSVFLPFILSFYCVCRPKETRNKFPLSGHIQKYEWNNISPIFPPRSNIYCFIVVCLPAVSFNWRLIFTVGNYGSLYCLFLRGVHRPRPHSGHLRTIPNLLLRSDLPRSRNTQHVVSTNKTHTHTHTHIHTNKRPSPVCFHNCSSLQQKFYYWGRESLDAEVTRLPVGLPKKKVTPFLARIKGFSLLRKVRTDSGATWLTFDPQNISAILTHHIPKHHLNFIFPGISKSLI